MRKLSDTVARLSALRAAHGRADAPGVPDPLSDLTDFGSNPGALRARVYVPANLPPGSPLVVVLHGCTQSAAAYDYGSGWSTLAERSGFAVLFPEQSRANNANLCFNWFVPGDAKRDCGEALSIRQMIARMAQLHAIDSRRIFVTGLSAGGAMTSVMMAAYPEVIAGGAVIAGLPYGVAETVPQAFDRMRGHGGPSGRQLVDLVLGASDHRGPWPSISVWHGTADQTVSLSNARAIVEQWRGLHALPETAATRSLVDGHSRTAWRDPAGRERIELFEIEGMGHGTPLRASGADSLGHGGPFMLDCGISSTRHIARFWGIASESEARSEIRMHAGVLEPTEIIRTAEMPPPAPPSDWPGTKTPPHAAHAGTDSIRSVIEAALRQAGLMK